MKIPAGKYFFKVNNGNTRTMYEILDVVLVLLLLTKEYFETNFLPWFQKKKKNIQQWFSGKIKLWSI